MTGANSRSLYAVVDDQSLMAELVSEMLTSAGSDVEVEVFSLGQHLLKSKNLKNFKAVIMDLSLPDIDGFDLMEQLAVDNKGLAVVLMSGH
jgi:FixJ family two-component response regulator